MAHDETNFWTYSDARCEAIEAKDYGVGRCELEFL